VGRLFRGAGCLISLAAREIIMGRHSNLGPIDPQIGVPPAQTTTSSAATITTAAHLPSEARKPGRGEEKRTTGSVLLLRPNLRDLTYISTAWQEAPALPLRFDAVLVIGAVEEFQIAGILRPVEPALSRAAASCSTYSAIFRSFRFTIFLEGQARP
jgi:hypothetical protein